MTATGFFEQLSDWMAKLFPALTLQAAYADTRARRGRPVVAQGINLRFRGGALKAAARD